MLREDKGFVWIESLVSLNIFILLFTTLIPIYTTVQKEKTLMKERSIYSLALYNELQDIIYEEGLRNRKTWQEKVKGRSIAFDFTREGAYIKGCVEWKNAKHKKERFCLYGMEEK